MQSKIFAIITVTLLCISSWAMAQSKISGKVVDDKGNPLQGASIYLENTLDGATTDSAGIFRFETEETGQHTLVVQSVGYSNAGKPLTLPGNHTGLSFKLKNTAKTLEEVTITAGAFEASNDKDKTVLKPLDIVTTAGAQADVVKAIETLPGTQKQGAQNGLFVRGGDASEANYVIDGLVVQNAFFSGPPGVATRSRFNAFQFKGVSFSSGGYSARYGQALSSVLELNSLDLPEQSTVNLGLNMAGVYASGSKLWKNSGGNVSVNYTNLQPFYGIAETNFDFYDVPKGGGASANYGWKVNKNGILKASFVGSTFRNGIGIPNPDSADQQIRFGLKNQNYVGNISYRQMIKEKWTIYAAGSYSYNKDELTFDTTPGEQVDERVQGRLEAKYFPAAGLSLLLGTEVQHYTIDNEFGPWVRGFDETLMAGYAEAEWTPVNWIALKPGVRYEHSELLQRNNIAPRMAVAIRAGSGGQISLAGGIFYQNPDYSYLYLQGLPNYNFDFQKAVHYIANYQWQKNDRTLRVEGYYKDYQSLIREYGATFNPNPNRFIIPNGGGIDNSGYGYATGAELFWRDRKSVKNLDYWISYSYIDTRRLYKNYPLEVTPDFISDHNLNLVTKYFIEKLQTQINATYSFATGRPAYYTPAGTTLFLQDRTPEYHNLSFTINHLRTIGKWFTVIYAGVDNVTNQKNIFGYRYSPDGSQRYPVVPALYRSVFVGINFSLTEFDRDEL